MCESAGDYFRKKRICTVNKATARETAAYDPLLLLCALGAQLCCKALERWVEFCQDRVSSTYFGGNTSLKYNDVEFEDRLCLCVTLGGLI